MLPCSVLHENRGRGGQEDIVGISWKPRSVGHPSAVLVVTCAHQVVVYKPRESRRTHQWSFKPSASSVFSHATVFLPVAARYVGVQRGQSLVTWLEPQHDVKRPLSVKAPGSVQAVHACTQLGDAFVVVLQTGAVCLYQGGLEPIAQCDPSPIPSPSAVAAAAKTEVLWSKVLGRRVLVLIKCGASARISTFALNVSAKPGAERGAPSVVSGTVTLASSHALARPSLGEGPAFAEGDTSLDEQMEACSAACLANTGGVFSVAWRSRRGVVWTKVVISASGVREEFTRPIGTPRLMVEGWAGGADDAVLALCNGHKPDSKSPDKSKSKKRDEGMSTNVSVGADIGRQDLPMLANADGGRLLVHSGGPSPRLAMWDATYGVLLDDYEAPEMTASVESPAKGKATSIVVSGDGSHLAVASGGKVVVCPLPVKEGGNLASLLRRKHPAALVPERSDGTGTPTVFRIHSNPCFPAVDLTANSSAAAGALLRKTGVVAPKEWERTVVSPFRKEESAVVKALEDATRRKDGGGFERVLRQHAQQRALAEKEQLSEHSSTTNITVASSAAQTAKDAGKHEGGSVGIGRNRGSKHVASLRWEHGRSNRRRPWSCSARVLSAAVELCILNPEANLWNALGLLVRSGGVSAREHRGLVMAVVKDGPQELLEEIMLHVPDLPEADAVRILRYFLSQAATQTRKTRSVSNHGVLPAGMAGTQGGGAGGGSPSNITVSGKGKLARRRRFRLLQKSRKATEPPLPKGKNEPSQQSEDVVECGVNGGAVGDNVSNAKVLKRRGTGSDGSKDVGGKVKKERPERRDDSAVDRKDGAKKEKMEKERGDHGAAGMEDRVKKKKKLLGIATPAATTTVTTTNETVSHEKKSSQLVIVAGTAAPAAPLKHRDDISSPQKHVKNNVVVVGLPNGSLSNGHHASDDDGGGSSDTGNISEEGDEEEALPKRLKGHDGDNAMKAGAAAGVVSDVGRAKGEAAPARPDGAVKTKKSRGLSNVTAAVRAERGLRVALTLPHNEAFLRSALSALSHGEVIVVLQILTRLLSEERTRETEQIVELKHSHAVLPGDSHSYISMNGVPPARTEAVVAWASAILDSHFTRLAIAGSHQDVLGVLQALKCAAVNEAECCDLLFQVRSLVDELGRRHAVEEEERRRPKRTLYSVRQLCF